MIDKNTSTIHGKKFNGLYKNIRTFHSPVIHKLQMIALNSYRVQIIYQGKKLTESNTDCVLWQCWKMYP
mgnify:CR=1 FL=1